MEAMRGGCSMSFQISTSPGGGKPNTHNVLVLNKNCNNPLINFKDICHWKSNTVTIRKRKCNLIFARCCEDKAPKLESGKFYSCLDGSRLLKTNAQAVTSLLNGRCIFLVGMMGSGKSTVGKILSEALGYSFVDSDKYVEQAVGGRSVTQIFQQCGESFFRENESEALRKLSSVPQQVVATGGGAVIRPINWKYMKQGITVLLSVPVDALARRIAAVGTDSRPLLHFDSGDPYTKAFMGLFTLAKKRSEAYANVDATVSLLDLAVNSGLEDISDITPTAIAIEVLVQIEKYLKGNSSSQMFP
ncbi:SKI domain-containing protein [Cephalotus follicularis]|uniref:shikimate kinase n=1 Tax=Cephalotus follicularis TaxID=3775 RepID=A0A1Q3BB15_CEPFO|nr:SKI domain-containing protein [Cephalotus follicularis]